MAERGVDEATAREENTSSVVASDGRFVQLPPRPVPIDELYLDKLAVYVEMRGSSSVPFPDFDPDLPLPDHLPLSVTLPTQGMHDAPAMGRDTIAEGLAADNHGVRPVWRDQPDWTAPENAVYRRDGRSFAKVIADGGLLPHGTDLNIDAHVLGATRNSGFTSFTKSLEDLVARDSQKDAELISGGEEEGFEVRLEYVYEAYHPHGIDVDATRRMAGDTTSNHQESEVVFPGGIDFKYVARVFPVHVTYRKGPDGLLKEVGTKFQPAIENPNFIGARTGRPGTPERPA